MARISRLKQLSGVAVLCFIFASAMYMMYLVYAQYQVREKLQRSYFERNLQENEKRAMAIGYFFSERLYDMATLAESRELALYFENQALGMSVEYGLGATINAVEELLSHFRNARQIGGHTIFARLAYAETSGKILFDSSDPRVFGKQSRRLAPRFPRSGNRAGFLCDKVGRDDFIVISAPFSFKGHVIGHLYGWIPFELVCQHFVEDSGGAGSQLNLLLFRGRYLFGSHDVKSFIPPTLLPDPAVLKPGANLNFSAPSSGRAPQQIHALLTQVEHTPFGLVSLTRTGSENPGPPPRTLLYILAGIGLALLVGGSAFYRVSMRSLALEVRLEETRIRERIVEENNNHLRKLLTALEQSSNSVMISDASGTIEYVNPHYCRVTGYDAAEIVGNDCWQVAGTNHPDRIWQDIRETVLGGNNWSGEFQSRRKSGELFWEQANISPVINEQGIVSGLIAIKEDITGRKVAELELRRAKEIAEAASRAKSAFLANMSHEIRTPMNGIIGMTELTLATGLDQQQRRYLSAIRESAENLLTIINDILDFSKIEAGKLELEQSPFLLRTAVGQALRTLAPKAAEKGLELIFAPAPELPDALIGDPGRLKQVLVNLIGNSVKFSHSGAVLLEIAMVREDGESCLLSFSVTDNGIGIPYERLKRIFEPFEQGDLSATKEFGGTGLGLSISKNLVELMDGSIQVQSKAGVGSTFSFTARFACCTSPAEVVPQVQLNGCRALVVGGDGDATRQDLCDCLRRWGITPHSVSDEAQTLELLRRSVLDQQPIDFLIMLPAPALDVCELARKIRDDASLATVHRVIMPHLGRVGDSRMCRELGIEGYLPLPLLPTELYDLLVALVSSNVAQAPPGTIPVTRYTVRENRQRLSILVAEDGHINQEIIAAILARNGHAVTMVSNGSEAISAWETAGVTYDLILMDIQMPLMDGLQATRSIREKEAAKGTHVPIVAMTAYAMKGDRERFLAAGMDDYVSKPFKTEEVLALLKRHGNPCSSLRPESEPALPNDAPSQQEDGTATIFNRQELLSRLGGQADMVSRLVEMFVAMAEETLPELERTAVGQDDGGVRRLLHTLKGAAANIGADRMCAVVVDLQDRAKSGEHEPLVHGIGILRREYEIFKSAAVAEATIES